MLMLLTLQCARQTTPTGGPRDTIPPTLISSVPANKTTNYTGQRIELTFDEAVALNNPREQLLVTPSIGKDFEMTVRKKNVLLDLHSKLKDTTTYTINFRESIQDITEKNPAQNLQMALSTGTYLDSLSINGYVYELRTGKAVENATVALYKSKDTFNIFVHTPEYLTITDKFGSFDFQNLKPDRYYIYAFNDKNKNIKVDSKAEHYGFIADSIQLAPMQKPYLEIPILALDSREFKLISARPYNTYYNIRISKDINTYSLEPISPEDSALLYKCFGENQANIHVYMPEAKNDSIAIHFVATDSIGFQIDTLLYAKLSPRESIPEKFQSTARNTSLFSQYQQLTSLVTFNKPVWHINYDSIEYLLDSLTTIPISPNDMSIKNPKSFLINKQIPEQFLQNDNEIPQKETDFRSAKPTELKSFINKLRFSKSAFISVDRDSSQSMEIDVKLLKPDNTGIITTQISTDVEHFIVQLLNKDYSINQAVHDQKSATFTNLIPGDYMINLVIDKNNNHQWDPGNYYLRVEPEPIIFYKNDQGLTTINLKANWELGPMLITYPQPVEKEPINSNK
jgi:uncharacterized protein (DUF2141 family)